MFRQVWVAMPEIWERQPEGGYYDIPGTLGLLVRNVRKVCD